MTFAIINLAGDRALVKGRDAAGTYNQQILDASEWKEFTARNKHNDAHEAFDAAVEAFFAPLNEAVDALKETAKPKLDPLFFVTVQEGSAAVAETSEVIVHLHQHSAILRLIEQDPDTDRLLWVNDTLEILELQDPKSPTITPVAVFDVETGGEPTESGEDEGLTKA